MIKNFRLRIRVFHSANGKSGSSPEVSSPSPQVASPSPSPQVSSPSPSHKKRDSIWT